MSEADSRSENILMERLNKVRKHLIRETEQENMQQKYVQFLFLRRMWREQKKIERNVEHYLRYEFSHSVFYYSSYDLFLL